MKKLLTLFLLAESLQAGTFYVDYSGGSDANNGTSTGTPWKHLPGDPVATGNAAAATAISGTVYLKGGITYAIAGSGSPIVIDHTHYSGAGPLLFTSGTNVSWGTGSSAIDGAGVGYAILDIEQMTNTTLRGLVLGNTIGINNGSDHFQDHAVALVDCMSNVLDNCTIYNIGTNSSACHANGVGPGSNSGAYNSRLIITNCTIHDVTQKCIEPYRAGGVTIAGNYLWNAADHCITFTASENLIYGNIISNAGVNVFLRAGTDPGYAIKVSIGSPVNTLSNMVYNNIISHCHRGAIFFDNGQNSGGWQGDYNKIFNNTIIDHDLVNTYGSGIRFGCQLGPVNNTMIMNNIICSEAAAGSAGAIITPVSIYAPSGGPSLGNNNIVAYNLFFGQNATVHPGLEIGGADHSPTWANFSDTGSTSPDFRFKVAANGTGNSFVFANQFFDIDPKFTSYPGNLTLLSSSPVKSAGTNLSAYFTKDFNGVTRSNWSMGAFEFGGVIDPQITVAPQNTTVFTNTSANFTVTATGTATLHYYWKFNGTPVGTDSSSYTRANCLIADNGGSVTVLVSNSVSTATGAAILTVTTDPRIVVQPQSTTVVAGNVASFSVTASGQTTLSYNWFRNGVFFSNIGNNINFTAQNIDNGALFYVVVSDTAGSVQSGTVTLNVNPSAASGVLNTVIINVGVVRSAP